MFFEGEYGCEGLVRFLLLGFPHCVCLLLFIVSFLSSLIVAFPLVNKLEFNFFFCKKTLESICFFKHPSPPSVLLMFSGKYGNKYQSPFVASSF